ncbi:MULTISPECIES: response regulator transcription factor [unclassified Duganella]|uniref:response regulator n=1 Tax=unclassified Duganella TaxID=2636909 RepID=UPI0006F6C545|nr:MULTISPECIES: response regulator transcription factor [unclassified Duganella]KQV55392.1 LuxR family transcriptional regulator [Duganella sp. Root336D2]KRB95845.1 LuxR family transcriptional regulator [Duganella sp. Root198D2]
MIRVVLVDDQMLVRSGIRGLLDMTPDIRVVAEAADGAQAAALLARTEADVLLLDVRMPHCSGLELLRGGQALPPAILLTTFDDEEVLFEGMRAGARGFLLKDISLERLADGIRSVAQGGTLFRPALTERTRAAFESARGVHDAGGTLSEREIEVLALVAAGMSNAEIAAALVLSEGTVKNHVSSILAKLGVRDRVRAVLHGLEMGLI